MRSKNSKRPTPAEWERMSQLKMIGCIPCWKLGFRGVCAAADHTKSGNKRVGHAATYANCDWHHQAIPFAGMTHKQCEAERGPSKANGSKPFHAYFGSEQELLALQETILSEQCHV